MTDFSTTPPLKSPREALLISGIIIIRDNQQIINFDDDSLGKPRLYCHNDDDGLITRQGASFDVIVISYCLTPRHGVAFDNNVKRLARPEKDHTNV